MMGRLLSMPSIILVIYESIRYTNRRKVKNVSVMKSDMRRTTVSNASISTLHFPRNPILLMFAS